MLVTTENIEPGTENAPATDPPIPIKEGDGKIALSETNPSDPQPVVQQDNTDKPGPADDKPKKAKGKSDDSKAEAKDQANDDAKDTAKMPGITPAPDASTPSATEESSDDPSEAEKPDIAGLVPGRNVYFYPRNKSGFFHAPIPGIVSQVFDVKTGEVSITLFPSQEQNPNFQTGYAGHVLFSEDKTDGTWGWMR